MNIDKEEREVLRSFESGEWVKRPNQRREIAKLRNAARATRLSVASMTIRLTTQDLEKIVALALEQGVPSEDLIARVLNQYASGTLVEAEPRKQPARPTRRRTK